MKAAGAALSDGTVTGLRLLPGHSNGHGKWQLRFVSPTTGKRRDMGLGVYPETSIAEARSAAIAARALIGQDKDPIDERQQHRTAVQATALGKTVTFAEAARSVHENLRPGWQNPKHADQWINTLNTYVFPFFGNRQVDSLKPADFADALRPIWLTKAETASRVRQRCKEVMDWCWVQELTTGNPVSIVEKLLPKQPSAKQRVQHHPAMQWRDIPEFLANEVRNFSGVVWCFLR